MGCQDRGPAAGLRGLDVEALLNELMEVGLAPKIEELRGLPLIGGFLTDERIEVR